MKKLTHHGHLAAQIKGTANSRYSSALDNKGQNNLSMKDPPQGYNTIKLQASQLPASP